MLSLTFDYGIRGGARIGNGTADFTLQDYTIQSAEVAGVWFFSGNGSAGETSTPALRVIAISFVSLTLFATSREGRRPWTYG